MNELFGSLKDFIVRDIIYIIGGVSVILSLLYSLGKIDMFREELSVSIVLYIAAIGYVIGWFIQGISALIGGRWMTTSLNYEPGKYIQKLHKRFLAASCWLILNQGFRFATMSLKVPTIYQAITL